MLSAFARRFATPDLRKKILFTLAIMVLYRLGATMPTPNTDTTSISTAVSTRSQNGAQNVYSLINLFSGGALLRLSVFALGIMPYITASIIIQLLTVVIPRFEQLKKEGQSGQNKLTQYTRYLTIGAGDPAVHRHRGAGAPAVSCSPAARASRFQTASSRWRHGHRDDRRYRGHHVVRRADHRPRCRQRHVAADVHLDRGPHPERGQGHPENAQGLLRLHCWSCLLGLAIIAAWCSSSRPSDGSRCSTPSG